MTKYTIMLEIGSSFSAVTEKNASFFVKEPSVVALDKVERQVLGIGNAALKLYASKMADVQLVYPILEGAIVDSDGAKELFKHLFSKILPQKAQIFPDTLVVCIVPCCLNTSDKRAIENILLSLGIKAVRFKESSLVDSIELFRQFHTNRGIVVNIGSDCTNIAAVYADGIVSGCTLYHSGKQLTDAITQKIREKYLLQLSFAEAEKLKFKCASLYSNDTSSVSVLGSNTDTGETEKVTVTARELYDTVSDFCRKYVSVIKSLISAIPREIVGLLRQEGVLLCGGGAELEGLESFLHNELDLPVRLANDSKNVTIEGARQL